MFFIFFIAVCTIPDFVPPVYPLQFPSLSTLYTDWTVAFIIAKFCISGLKFVRFSNLTYLQFADTIALAVSKTFFDCSKTKDPSETRWASASRNWMVSSRVV